MLPTSSEPRATSTATSISSVPAWSAVLELLILSQLSKAIQSPLTHLSETGENASGSTQDKGKDAKNQDLVGRHHKVTRDYLEAAKTVQKAPVCPFSVRASLRTIAHVSNAEPALPSREEIAAAKAAKQKAHFEEQVRATVNAWYQGAVAGYYNSFRNPSVQAQQYAPPAQAQQYAPAGQAQQYAPAVQI